MKYSYKWLKELSKTQKTPEALADILTMRAFELEDMSAQGGSASGGKTGKKDVQLEFGILPNRGHDALSHVGLSREICVCENRKFLFSSPNIRSALEETHSDDRQHVLKLDINIKDKKLCSRYIGAVLKDIKVGPSPKWVRDRLLVCGIKPINNVVDATNYIMLETGQPLHAFDITKLETRNAKPVIVVRKAKKGEKIRLLDEKTYELSENDLVIADTERPIALAGVMGGFNSSVTKKTTSIVLESANFNSTSIRKTRMRHNIITESSYRFEREIDPNLAELGMARAIELLKEIGGKNIEMIALTDIYPKKVGPWQIKLNSEYVNDLLGEKISISQMKNILGNLGLKVKISGRFLICEAPTVRIDLKTQEDLIEEIGRIYGYENIKERVLVAEVKTPPQNEKRDFENKLRDILTGLGFSEVMNYSFYSADDIAKCNLKIEDHVEVANPLSLDQQYLRWSLVPNVLKNVALNLKNFSEIEIFEIGNKFCFEKSKSKEATVLVGAIARKTAKENLFFELKGKIEILLNNLGYKNTQYSILNTQYLFWHQSRTAEIILKGKKIGRIGEVSPQVLRKYGIKSRVAVFGIRISEVINKIGYPEERLYRSISKFPVVERDISMFVEKDTKYNEIETKISKAGGNLIKNVDLFDTFEKEGEKSLALRIKIGSDEKTLTSAEIDAVMKKIISALEKNLKVKIRK